MFATMDWGRIQTPGECGSNYGQILKILDYNSGNGASRHWFSANIFSWGVYSRTTRAVLVFKSYPYKIKNADNQRSLNSFGTTSSPTKLSHRALSVYQVEPNAKSSLFFHAFGISVFVAGKERRMMTLNRFFT